MIKELLGRLFKPKSIHFRLHKDRLDNKSEKPRLQYSTNNKKWLDVMTYQSSYGNYYDKEVYQDNIWYNDIIKCNTFKEFNNILLEIRRNPDHHNMTPYNEIIK